MILAIATTLIMWDTYMHQSLRDALVGKIQEWVTVQVNALNTDHKNSMATSGRLSSSKLDDMDGTFTRKSTTQFDAGLSDIQLKIDKGQNTFTADEIHAYMAAGRALLQKNEKLQQELKEKQTDEPWAEFIRQANDSYGGPMAHNMSNMSQQQHSRVAGGYNSSFV
jgi:hypothetical protein